VAVPTVLPPEVTVTVPVGRGTPGADTVTVTVAALFLVIAVVPRVSALDEEALSTVTPTTAESEPDCVVVAGTKEARSWWVPAAVVPGRVTVARPSDPTFRAGRAGGAAGVSGR